MARIKNPDIVPYGGWRYVQPETAARFETDHFAGLVAQVAAHRAYKGLPAATPEAVGLDIERQLCLQMSAERCAPEPGEVHRPVRDLTSELTPALALSLGRAIGAFLAGGGALVPRETAAARAATCRGCPFNKPSKFCSCSAVYAAVEALVPADRKEPGLSVCTACGCSLVAKVNLPDTVIAASLPAGIVMPSWCWQERARGSGNEG